MLVLRKKVRRGVFPRCKSRSIDDAPEFSGTINQRILHRRHFLVEPNLVFIKALTAHKATFVSRLFSLSVSRKANNSAAFKAITSDLLEHRARPIDEDR